MFKLLQYCQQASSTETDFNLCDTTSFQLQLLKNAQYPANCGIVLFWGIQMILPMIFSRLLIIILRAAGNKFLDLKRVN